MQKYDKKENTKKILYKYYESRGKVLGNGRVSFRCFFRERYGRNELEHVMLNLLLQVRPKQSQAYAQTFCLKS